MYFISTLVIETIHQRMIFRTVKYIRVSTAEQNTDRQLDKSLENFVDKCSGSIPFQERKEGRRLANLVSKPKNDIDKILVHSIDRLGRNTRDILDTIDYFTNHGVCIESKKEGFRTLDENGKKNATAMMVISIMATLSEWELNMIKERRLEGIARAKAKGKYAGNGGRPPETDAQFLAKDKSQGVLKLLKITGGKKLGLRDIAFKAKVSLGTVQKVKAIAIQEGILSQNEASLPSKQDQEKLKRFIENTSL
ncbi:MAG: recombinase family protein [Flavobacteriaceae bacterium]|nr:recombinase family protein [Flavobacteriaceae bacterium]